MHAFRSYIYPPLKHAAARIACDSGPTCLYSAYLRLKLFCHVWHYIEVQTHKDNSPTPFLIFTPVERCNFWRYRSTSLKFELLSFENGVRYMHHVWTCCASVTWLFPVQISAKIKDGLQRARMRLFALIPQWLKFELPSFQNGVRYPSSFWTWCVTMIRQCSHQIRCWSVLALFKTLMSALEHPENHRKSCGKSTITQPRIDQSRSNLVRSLNTRHPIY